LRAYEWLGFVQYEAMGYTKWAHNELFQLDAAEKTGRPLKDFLPVPPGGKIEDLKDMFDFGGRKVIEF